MPRRRPQRRFDVRNCAEAHPDLRRWPTWDNRGMSHSYLCAVSGQSIPVYTVEPTEVVVVLPDDSLMHGTWDGYGHLLPTGVTNIQAGQDIRRYSSAEFNLQKRLTQLLGSDDPDVVEAAVKMVKARFYEFGSDKHRFANLPTSPPCPHKGMFYKDKSEWNSPKRPQARNLAPWVKPARPEGLDVLHAGAEDPDA
jgi:hypothetical protein